MDDKEEPKEELPPLVKTAWRKVPYRLLTPEEREEYEAIVRELYRSRL